MAFQEAVCLLEGNQNASWKKYQRTDKQFWQIRIQPFVDLHNNAAETPKPLKHAVISLSLHLQASQGQPAPMGTTNMVHTRQTGLNLLLSNRHAAVLHAVGQSFPLKEMSAPPFFAQL